MAEFFPLPPDNEQPLRPFEAERAWHVVNQAEKDTREFLKLEPGKQPDILVKSEAAQHMFDMFVEHYKYAPTDEERK